MISTRRGLYAITDRRLTPGERLFDAVAETIAGGAAIVQYRDKEIDATGRLAEVARLVNLCHDHGVLCIVNDDVMLAKASGADGVHLGEEDVELAHARNVLGSRFVIGISCYDNLERAVTAQANGADYVAFGSFFPSPTKPGAVCASLELLRAAKQRLSIPIVAIGGITAENGDLLVSAGADFLAVISGVFGQTDIRAASQRFADMYEKN